MRILIEAPRGEAPRLAPQLLPANAAQQAINARLVDGNLDSWRQFLQIQQLTITPSTIYLLNGVWLAWANEVDVARGVVPGDTSFRTYLTGPDEYDRPQWTNFELATASPGGAFPVITRPIGTPDPSEAPTVAAGVDDTPTSFSINVTDAGNELATSWTVSATVPFTD